MQDDKEIIKFADLSIEDKGKVISFIEEKIQMGKTERSYFRVNTLIEDGELVFEEGDIIETKDSELFGYWCEECSLHIPEEETILDHVIKHIKED